MPAAHPLPQTLGELRTSTLFSEARLKSRSVKDEMRTNLIARLKTRETIFPGIVGLRRHGRSADRERGSLEAELHSARAARPGEEPHPARADGAARRATALHRRAARFATILIVPLCKRCRDLIADRGDATPIAYLSRDERYVEKLATPDVTVADLIGDLDPIKAARGGEDLSSELTMHYGLLPRANRGIFAINELPDLAGKDPGGAVQHHAGRRCAD